MLKIDFKAITALAKFWSWRCPSCKCRNRIFYSPWEIGFVKCESCELEREIVNKPERTKQGRGYDWSPGEERIFASRYPTVPNSVLADQLNRKPDAIQNKAKQLGVKKTEPAKMKAWEQSQARKKRAYTADETAWMRAAVNEFSNQEIAELLGKSYWSVVGHLHRNNITRK